MRIIILGKTILFFLFSLVSADSINIYLDVRTTNGEKLEQAAIGQPFLLEVTVEGISGQISSPVIQGLDRFSVKRTGYYMSSVNGKSTTKISYQVRIDQSGTYQIGPATIMYQQKKYSSRIVTVVVDEVSQSQKSLVAGKSSALQNSFLQLIVDTDRAVVGQKISALLRFFYQDPSTKLSHIGKPEMPGFEVKPSREPQGGTKDVQGKMYHYVEWHWDMFPTTPGELIIPAYYADYEIQAQNNRGLNGFFMFVNSFSDRKRVYSNALKVLVDPLPFYDGHVDAIGSFNQISASINPAIAKEGEGMTFEIEIEGEGDFDAITALDLHFPEELKYYESKKIVIGSEKNNTMKKKFEFIVQGMKCGDWEIPKQSFTYFDVKSHSYKTMFTSPLFVTIVPNPHMTKNELINYEKHEANTDKNSEDENDVIPINTLGPWSHVEETGPMSWWLFCILFILPLIYLFFSWVISKSFYSSNMSKIRACKQARRQLEVALSINNDAEIYYIFKRLFTVLFGDGREAVALEDVKEYLKSRKNSDVFIDQWERFFNLISQAAFCSMNDRKNNNELYEAAREWINRLENI